MMAIIIESCLKFSLQQKFKAVIKDGTSCLPKPDEISESKNIQITLSKTNES